PKQDSYDKKPYPPKQDSYDKKPYPPKDDSYDKKPYPPRDDYGMDKPYPKESDKDPKQYNKSDVNIKSKKKIVIIDCNNLNVNADELSDLEKVGPAIQRALASDKDNDTQWGTYNEYSQDDPNARIYNIEPNTKVIFKCNNDNHNLISPVATVEDEDETNTPIATDNTELTAPETAISANAAVTTKSDVTANNNVETLDTVNSDSNVDSSLGTSETAPSDNVLSMPSTGVSPDSIPQGPFILPIPSYLK
ncbi:MAG TPA: hypothetical protein VFM31_03795, partial [Nitrososphaeraceae archaeon]|nr:hypothetical protein [Nitrososphaeraceae archaeon]